MKKKIAVASLTVLFVIALFIWAYNLAQADHWREQNLAVKNALAVSEVVYGPNLHAVDETDWFAGDNPYTIVFGRDGQNREVIAWVSDEQTHLAYADEGISREQAVALVKKDAPGAVIIHAVPGKLDEEFIWEVYYKAKTEGATQYFYKYFRFADGELLDTFHMRR